MPVSETPPTPESTDGLLQRITHISKQVPASVYWVVTASILIGATYIGREALIESNQELQDAIERGENLDMKEYQQKRAKGIKASVSRDPETGSLRYSYESSS